MSAQLTFIGMDELRKALLDLPRGLAYRSATIVSSAADGAAAEIKAAYPEGETGNLRKGVRTRDEKAGPHTVRRSVRSTAQHAILYERGTKTRQTSLGYKRGHMFKQYGLAPGTGANVFVPIVERRRRAMFEQLVTIVEDEGLSVRR